MDPELFERVQSIRERRRTAHTAGGGSFARRPYPLVRLMRCVECGSGYHGDANGGRRRIRHSRRPACAPSATYAAEPYEEQLARVFDGVRVTEADIDQVLAAMRRVGPVAPAADPVDVEAARAELQRQLVAGELTIDAFSRAWRRTDRPIPSAPALPDELRLRRARKRLAEFGVLWRNPAVPDRLRTEALHEIIARVDVQGSQLLAVHPQPNENAWLLGLAALRQEQHVGMVGARGLAPSIPTSESTSSGSRRIGP